jgi:hypothetical protein
MTRKIHDFKLKYLQVPNLRTYSNYIIIIDLVWEINKSYLIILFFLDNKLKERTVN